MDSGKARSLFLQFAGTMAFIEVETVDGLSIGSAFHVGEGVFVTARHVLWEAQIKEIRLAPSHEKPLQILKGPFFHSDEAVDVAIFQVQNIDPSTPFVELGGHLDDWLGSTDLVLHEALIFGYPPIPCTREPHLVTARAEINALVDLRHSPNVHFILSATPRGGFSGGLVVLEEGFALGVVTSSLINDSSSAETGFFAALSVEPIYVCLSQNKLIPACQAEGWDGLWHIDTVATYIEPGQVGRSGVMVSASIDVYDDGKEFYVKAYSVNADLLTQASQAGYKAVMQYLPVLKEHGQTASIKPTPPVSVESRLFIDLALHAMEQIFLSSGLVRYENSMS